jgi:ketosteroid isomerase-like protein
MSVTRPEEFHRSFAEAFNSGDVDVLLSHYEPDATLVPQPGQLASGHAAIREALLQFMAIGKMTAETRYCIESGDVALASASWEIKGTGPDGAPVEVKGLSGDIFRRQSDGNWLLAVDHPFGAS